MEFSLKLVLSRNVGPDCLVALISTILFHRFFGSLEPKYKETHGVTYPQPNTYEVEALLQTKLKECTQLFKDPATNSISTSIEFYNQSKRRHSNWFVSESKPKIWEKWVISVLVDDLENSDSESAPKELTRMMFKIIQLVDEHKQHTPPVTRTEVMPFPYQVNIRQNPY